MVLVVLVVLVVVVMVVVVVLVVMVVLVVVPELGPRRFYWRVWCLEAHHQAAHATHGATAMQHARSSAFEVK